MITTGSRVDYCGFIGTVIATYKHPQTTVDIAVVDFSEAMSKSDLDGFAIIDGEFQWDGSCLSIAAQYLTPEPETRR